LVNNIIPNQPASEIAKEPVRTAAAGTKPKHSKSSKSN
jgi:hypothetical protein